jgi:hypothetical protein
MSKKKLVGIIVGCIVAIVAIIVVVTHMFTPTPTYTLTVSVSPSGAGSVSSSGGQYKSGAQVILTASPASGYTFDHWSGSASGNTSSIAITMESDENLTANFRAQGELTIISASATKTLIYVGDEFCVTAVIKNTGNVTIFTCNLAGAKFEPEDAVQVEKDPECTCLACFELDPGNSIGTMSLCCCPTSSWFRALKAGPVTCTITAGWSPNASSFESYECTKTFTFNITASSSPLVLYTLATNTSGQGYMYPSAGAHTYRAGTSVGITAYPYSGWKFDHWEGDASGTNSTITVTMYGNRTVTAIFVKE